MMATSPAHPTSRAGIWRRAREQFLLEDSERQVRTRRPEQQDVVGKYHRAAAERAAVADDLSDGRSIVSSMLLYREAIRLFIAAAVAAHDDASDPRAALADADAPWQALDTLSRRAAIGEPPRAVEASRKILAADHEPLVFDEAAPEQLLAQRTTIKEAVAWLSGLVEPRTLARIRAERRMRVSLLVCIAVVVLVLVPWKLLRTPNLALHRPVSISSRLPGSAAPEDNSGVVNGLIESNYGIHTNRGGGWVMLDLERPHRIATIKIFNRADGFFDEGLPLRLELSEDAQHWTEAARRTAPFSSTDPWIVKPQGARARYVRVASDNYVALTEIEIFGE